MCWTWHDNSKIRWAAYGTDDKLYAYRFDTDTCYDITPAGVGALDPPGALDGYGLGDYGADALRDVARSIGRRAGHRRDNG